MKIIKYFEAFTKNILEELKKTERTYLKRRFHEDVQNSEIGRAHV